MTMNSYNQGIARDAKRLWVELQKPENHDVRDMIKGKPSSMPFMFGHTDRAISALDAEIGEKWQRLQNQIDDTGHSGFSWGMVCRLVEAAIKGDMREEYFDEWLTKGKLTKESPCGEYVQE